MLGSGPKSPWVNYASRMISRFSFSIVSSQLDFWLILASTNPLAVVLFVLMTVSGWGHQSSGGWDSPPVLHSVDVPGISNEQCDNMYANEEITDAMMCAGAAEGGAAASMLLLVQQHGGSASSGFQLWQSALPWAMSPHSEHMCDPKGHAFRLYPHLGRPANQTGKGCWPVCT